MPKKLDSEITPQIIETPEQQIVASNLERFITEQDDQRWRDGVLIEWIAEKQLNNEQKAWLENRRGLQELSESDRALFFFSEETDNVILVPHKKALEVATFVAKRDHYEAVKPSKLAWSWARLGHATIYAFLKSEEHAKQLFDELTKVKAIARHYNLRGIQTLKTLDITAEEMWGKAWWADPISEDQKGELFTQSLPTKLSFAASQWDLNKRFLGLCRTLGISHVLTDGDKTQENIFAHHFVRSRAT